MTLAIFILALFIFAREAEVNIVPVKKEAVADFFDGNLEQWAVLLDNDIIKP